MRFLPLLFVCFMASPALAGRATIVFNEGNYFFGTYGFMHRYGGEPKTAIDELTAKASFYPEAKFVLALIGQDEAMVRRIASSTNLSQEQIERLAYGVSSIGRAALEDKDVARAVIKARESALKPDKKDSYKSASRQVDALVAHIAKQLRAPSAEGFDEGVRAEQARQSARTHEKLKAAFMPLMSALRDRARDIPDSRVQARLADLARSTPIEEGRYRDSADVGSSHIQPSIDSAVENARRRYDFSLLDGPASRFLHVWPPSDFRGDHYGPLPRYLGMLVTPVGSYGEGFARQLLRTSQIMMDLAQNELETLSEKTYARHKKLLIKETARASGTVSGGVSIAPMAPLVTMLEGILTFHQFLGVVLSEKVPGADSGAQALHDLVFKGANPLGLTAEFTRRIPLGLIGPMNLMGKYLKEPFTRSDDGRLRFSQKTRELLHVYREAEGTVPGICPMASSGAGDVIPGLQMLAEAYWRVFTLVGRDT